MIALRSTVEADGDLLRELFESARPDLALIPLPPSARSELVAQQHRAQLSHYAAAYPGAQYLVIEAGGKAVGQLILWQDQTQLRVVDVSVLPAQRGRGIGGLLMTQLQDQARDMRLSLQLAVWSWNDDALRFYRKLGFRQTGEGGEYLQLRWEPHLADYEADHEQVEVG